MSTLFRRMCFFAWFCKSSCAEPYRPSADAQTTFALVGPHPLSFRACKKARRWYGWSLVLTTNPIFFVAVFFVAVFFVAVFFVAVFFVAVFFVAVFFVAARSGCASALLAVF